MSDHYGDLRYAPESLVTPIEKKPHITLIHGYWRIMNLDEASISDKAHAFIYKLNSGIHHEKSKIPNL